MLGPRGRLTTYSSAYIVLEPFSSEVDRLMTGSLADNTVHSSYSLDVQILDDFNLSTSWSQTVDVIAHLSSHGYQYSTVFNS